MKRQTRKKFRIIREITDPRTILLYLSERGIPRVIPTPERVIEDASLYLKDEDYMWGTRLWAFAKQMKPISQQDLLVIVQKAMTKKYKERSSPRFPANMLCGWILKGNDGKYYVSLKTKSGCVWRLSLGVPSYAE